LNSTAELREFPRSSGPNLAKEAKSEGDRQQLLLLAADHLKLAQAEELLKQDSKQTK
jgi:hypothetical protein